MVQQNFKLKNKLPPFTQIPNDLITGPLSPLAKATYCYLASRPDEWDFWFNNIVTVMHVGVSSAKKALKELVDSGWIERQQTRTGGRWGVTVYQVNYSPWVENRTTVAVPPLPYDGTQPTYKYLQPITTKNKDNSLGQKVQDKRDTLQTFKRELIAICPNFMFALPNKLGYAADHRGFELQNGYIFDRHNQKFLDKIESFPIWQYLYIAKKDVFELVQAQSEVSA